MAVKKVTTGWQADFHPNGRFGPRIRKTFRLKRDAETFELNEKSKARTSPDYQAPVKDNRKLSELAQSWFDYSGHELASGKKRLKALQLTAKSLGDPIARNADPRDFLDYRRVRVASGVSENHLNHELVYLKTMFNKLIKLGDWRFKNPYENVDPLKFSRRVLDFLSIDEVSRLLAALDDSVNQDVTTITKICLATGCRWGEAEGLEARHVANGKLMFEDTKNGENRSVPIADDLTREILTGRQSRGRLFRTSWKAFSGAIDRAGIQLEPGQLTHVCRHTFASHFMMAGGDILVLNKILGHKSLEMTMRYAHLSPHHFEDALDKNPLAILATISTE